MSRAVADVRPLPPPPPESGSPPEDEEVLILRQVEAMRRKIATVEIVWRSLALVAGMIAYGLLAAVVDQWIYPHGMPAAVRWLLWIVFILASGGWIVLSLGPYLIRRIHPVFAAYQVEQAVPTLKHSLISFLLLRGEKDALRSDPLKLNVFRGLERNTAQQVSQVSPEIVVDRSAILRTGYVLIALLAVFALVVLLSPKNPLVSAARAILPWSRIAPPSRVKIDVVQPGTTEVLQGDRVVVSAFIQGLWEGEEARVVYSTADGQAVDQSVPLQPVPGKSGHYECELSPSIQQNTTYRLVAGDAVTPDFHLTVVTPLRVKIQKVEYRFPAYTKLEPRVVEHLGDIQAIEGTEVTIHAEAPESLRNAEITIEGDRRGTLRMVVEGKHARATMRLKLNKVGSTLHEYSVYSIRAESQDGRPSVDPVKYTIEVVPDMPPTARWESPSENRVNVPVNGSLPLRIKAEDPDFGLQQIVLTVESLGKKVAQEVLLDRPKGDAHIGEFSGEYLFVPSKLGLATGDVALCRVEVADNREPTSNLVKLPELEIHIGPAERGEESRSEESQQKALKGQNGKPGESPPDKSSGQTQPPSPLGEQPSAKPNQPGRQPEQSRSPGAARQPESPDQPNQQNQSNQRNQMESSQKSTSGSTPQSSTPQQSAGDSSGTPPSAESGQPANQTNAEKSSQGQQSSSPEPQMSGNPTAQEQHGKTEDSGSGESQTGSQGGPGKQPPGTKGGQGQAGSMNDTPGRQAEGSDTHKSGESPQQGDQRSHAEEGTPAGLDRHHAGEQAAAANQDQSQGSTGQGQQGAREGSSPDRTDSMGAGGKEASDQGPSGTDGARWSQGNEAQQSGSGKSGLSGEKQQSSSSGTGGSGTGESNSQEGTASSSQGATEGMQQGEKPLHGGTSKAGGTEGEQSSGGNVPGDGQRRDKIDGISNPGDAIERILKYLERSGAAKPDGSASKAQNNSSQTANSNDQQPGSGNQGATPTPPPGQRPGSQQESPNSSAGTPSNGQAPPDRDARAVSPGQAPPGGNAAQTADSHNHAGGGESPPASSGMAPPQADRAPQQNVGAPDTVANPPRSNERHGTSNREGESGDQSGLGGQGGGQQTPGQGSGAAGSQSPADSQSGNPSPGAGPEASASSGNQASSSGGSSQGGGATGDSGQSGQGGQQSSAQGSSAGGGRRAPNGFQPGNASRGGGLPGGGSGGGGAWPGTETPVDDPNLEFARQQTDLVLRYLEEQIARQNPDENLLKELGWTKEEMAQFVRRWQELKKAAEADTPQGKDAKKRLNEILRSLGLRPSGTEIRRNDELRDTVHGLEAGRDIPPPPQWSDYFREYLKSLGAAQ
ncbi:hypothetical protein [Thermogutta sp.]|uniref:hypothetical protein n=1 Tax=Thermogutta sp. TaxID=1962930 RepID=UPI00321FFE95